MLQFSIAILRSPVGEEALFRIGPEHLVEGVEPLLAAQLHDGFPAFFKRALKQDWQGLIQRLARQVVEPDVHQLPTSTMKVRSELVQMSPSST